MNFLLTYESDIVGGLHMHKVPIFTPKAFSMRGAMSPERAALPMEPAMLRGASLPYSGDCGVNESGILPVAFSGELLELLIAHCGEVDAVRGVLGWGL